MTKDELNHLDSIRCRLHDAETRLRWMKSWGETLYAEDAVSIGNSKFHLRIENNQGKCILSREIAREDVESEYQAELQRLQLEKELIEKEIEAL